jgi:hypothetical protein
LWEVTPNHSSFKISRLNAPQPFLDINIKSAIYRCTDHMASFNEFKQQITTAAETVPPEMLRHVWVEISCWVNLCHATNEYVETY